MSREPEHPRLSTAVADAPSPSQEDVDAGLEHLQSMDMVDMSVLDEAEAEDSSAPDFGEEDGGGGDNGILAPLCDSKECVAAQLGPLPAQLPGHAVGNLEVRGVRGAGPSPQGERPSPAPVPASLAA